MDNIPPIVPSRDEVAARSGNRKSRARSGNGGERSAGTSLFARLFIAIALVVAAVACAWAWQLQQELLVANERLEDYSRRIGGLEDLLSDTDESMNQSSAVMSAQLKNLDSEMRKLWDARKSSNGKIAKLEKGAKSRSSQVSKLGKTDTDTTTRLAALVADVETLSAVADDLERLLANAKTNEAQLERLSDDVNRFNLESAKLQKRVAANEEWVESINGFRKQVNRKLVELQGGASSQ
jgi:chromosome segregation ATPase